MEHVSTYILLFITLFQLCRAELTGSWYSANVINDGDFSPKPLSEIFSTEPPPFSSTNPIVVLSKSTTLPTPISTSMSPGSSYATPSITPELISTYSTTPSTVQNQAHYMPSSLPQQPFSQSAILDPKPFDLGPFPFPFNQDKLNSQSPDYFMTYQQVQNLPPTGPHQTFSTYQTSSTFAPSPTFQPELSTPQSTFSTFKPELSTPPSTFSTFQPEVSSTPLPIQSTFQPGTSSISTLSTFRPETSTPQTTLFFTPSSESTFPSNFPSNPQPSSTTPTPQSRTTRITTKTSGPCNTTAQPTGSNPLQRFPTLRIRMVAPSGSITNVNINPIVSTTTRRPRTTTTRKPTTTRTRRTKRNRNTFDGCIRTCEDRGRNPICASPLAQIPIEPNKLKGFPSVCHMACHNSFKRDQYEMLVQGKCGKLRTRIKTVDAEKLKRGELNKAQYTIVDGDQTILEFSSLPR